MNLIGNTTCTNGAITRKCRDSTALCPGSIGCITHHHNTGRPGLIGRATTTRVGRRQTDIAFCYAITT